MITNTNYLSGLLTLSYSLKRSGSKYPLVALYTDAFPAEGQAALERRGVARKRVAYLLPTKHKDYSNDPRFYDCWSKLTPFSLTEYERVVQLDSDMQVLRNMDELMELELDAPSLKGQGSRVFAASHACACNPLNKPHYPKDWYVCQIHTRLDEWLKRCGQGRRKIARSQLNMTTQTLRRLRAPRLQQALA